MRNADGCDCMLVVGTSATVCPAAQFPITVCRNHGDLVEFNPHESNITRMCLVSVRAPAGKALPVLVEKIRERLPVAPTDG